MVRDRLGRQSGRRSASLIPIGARGTLRLVTEIERVLRVLEAAGVRYLVVGGVAVVLHGHPRFTADLDLAVALEPSNVRSAFAALATLGYRPRVPVSVEIFADPGERQRLVQEKGMTVLSFSSPELPMTEVDVFADPPFVFEETYRRADRVELGEVSVHVASIRDVIAMKRRVGRAKDLEDVAMLARLARDRGEPIDD